jgi:plasmid stabilization system protein ParE
MSLPVALTDEAEADLEEDALWYEQQAGLGAALVAEVRDVLRRLSATQEMHQKVLRDVRRALVKRFPYSVFYRVYNDRVEVLAVFHNRRDPSVWQSRV